MHIMSYKNRGCTPIEWSHSDRGGDLEGPSYHKLQAKKIKEILQLDRVYKET